MAHRAGQIGTAVQNIGSEMFPAIVPRPEGTEPPETRSNWSRAADVLTAGAPLIAPGLTALGTAAGAAARAYGASEPAAETIDTAAQLAGGLGQAAYRGIAGVVGAKKAAVAPFEELRAQAAQAGNRITLGTSTGDDLLNALREQEQHIFTTPKEKAAIRPLIDKLWKGRWSAGYPVAGPGVTYGDLDQALLGLSKKKSFVAGIIDKAAQSLLTPEQQAMRVAAKKAYAPFTKPGPFKAGVLNTGRIAGGVAGGYIAGEKFLEGKYKQGAAALGAAALGGLSTGQLLTGARAMAGPLARTAVAVGGSPGGQELLSPSPDESVPGNAPEPDTAPEAPEPTPAPDQTVRVLPGPYGREIAAVSSLVGVPPELIRAHMRVESSGNADSIGDNGRSFGLMQIQPGTAATVAAQARDALGGQRPDLMNPLHNLLIGGLLLRRYLDQTNGDWAKAAQMYNGGEHTSGNAQTRWYAGKIGENFMGGG